MPTKSEPVVFISEEQDAIERKAISGFFQILDMLQNGGLDATQVVTSFLANLCMDQNMPHRSLKIIVEGTRAKIAYMRTHPLPTN